MEHLIEYKEMREAIVRVRELHKPKQMDRLNPLSLLCTECSGFNTSMNSNWFNIYYPCPTIKALDGEK